MPGIRVTILNERRVIQMAIDSKQLTVAAKVLASAEKKLAKLQGRVDESVAKAVAKAKENATKKLAAKITAATEAVAVAKKTCTDLISK